MGRPHPPLGYWVDMPNAYITYDNRYIESVWWLLGELYKKAISTKATPSSPTLPPPALASAHMSSTSPDATAT